MVFGGTRFTRRARPRPAPGAIDVEVRPPHKTLYEVLVAPPTTSSRQLRRIARALRRNLPSLSELDDVCLAEQVLGRRDLRAEYDALLARARAAKLTLPQIGAAIEGSRLGAAAPFAGADRESAGAAQGGNPTLGVAAAIAAVAIVGVWLGASNRHRTDRDRPVAPPIARPAIDVPRIELPRFDVHELGLDKVDPALLGIPELATGKREPGPAVAPRHTSPRRTPAKPGTHEAAPAPAPAP